MPPRRKPVVSGNSLGGGVHPAQHFEPFLQYLAAERGMSKNTILAYRNDLNQFLSWLSTRKVHGLDQIDLPLLGDFLAHLRKRELAASTVARRIVALKMFFQFLVLEQVITENKIELLSSPKLWQYLPTVLSPEVVDDLLAAPSEEDRYRLRDRAVLTTLYATGCRASEVSNLRRQDLKLSENFCRCIGKGNKERIVNLNPVAVSAIEAYLEHERPKLVRSTKTSTDAVFVARGGKALSRVMIWHLVKRYSIRVGCTDVSPHTLRHSFATHMLAGGAEIRALQEMLGHASIRTTQIYTQVEHSRLKSIHSKCHPHG
jgi:integrase/recombinase XerD